MNYVIPIECEGELTCDQCVCAVDHYISSHVYRNDEILDCVTCTCNGNDVTEYNKNKTRHPRCPAIKNPVDDIMEWVQDKLKYFDYESGDAILMELFDFIKQEESKWIG